MVKISDKLVTELLELSDLYKIMGEPYKSKAYMGTARTLRMLKESNENYDLPLNAKELIKLKSIGKSTADKIINFYKDGHIKLLKELNDDKVIDKLIDIAGIYGFGFKGAKKLYEKGYKTMDDIKAGYVKGEIKLTRGQKVGIQYYDDLQKKIPRKELESLERNLKKLEKKSKNIDHIHIMGSYRRGKKLLKDIDILISGKSPKVIDDLLDYLKEEYKYVDYFSKGPKKFMGLFIIKKIIRHVDIIYSTPDEYPTKLNYFTGSKEFNVRLRNIALQQGYKLSDQGLFKGDKKIKLKNEREIFDILGVKYLKPQERK